MRLHRRIGWARGLLRLLAVAAWIGFQAPQAGAQTGGAGGTGLAFLKIGVGGRSAALGEAAAALIDGPSATYWNPAALDRGRPQAFLAHSQWLQDVSNEFAAVRFPAFSGSMALFLQVQSIDGIPQRDRPSAEPVTEIAAHDVAAGVSYAQELRPGLSVGATLKYVGERIWTYAANGIAVDAGLRWRPTDFSPLTFSLSLHNLGAMGRLRQERITLPALLRAAVALEAYSGAKTRLRLVAGTRSVFNGASQSGVGAELEVLGRLALRGGYRSGVEESSLSGGIGFVGRRYRVDYGYLPFSGAFGDTHRISFLLEL